MSDGRVAELNEGRLFAIDALGSSPSPNQAAYDVARHLLLFTEPGMSLVVGDVRHETSTTFTTGPAGVAVDQVRGVDYVSNFGFMYSFDVSTGSQTPMASDLRGLGSLLGAFNITVESRLNRVRATGIVGLSVIDIPSGDRAIASR